MQYFYCEAASCPVVIEQTTHWVHFPVAAIFLLIHLISGSLLFMQCGNGVQEEEEECDGRDIGDHTCQSVQSSK